MAKSVVDLLEIIDVQDNEEVMHVCAAHAFLKQNRELIYEGFSSQHSSLAVIHRLSPEVDFLLLPVIYVLE